MADRIKGITIISIHALRVEGDINTFVDPSVRLEFLSTPSGWRATRRPYAIRLCADEDFYPRPPGGGRRQSTQEESGQSRFLSTPSGWRATFAKVMMTPPARVISIHALRVEGDHVFVAQSVEDYRISIHALRVEGDQGHRRRQQRAAYFYPRPPGGGRLLSVRISSEHVAPISIHALRVEGDSGLIVPKRPVKLNFYPRPPGGGRRRTEAEWWRRSYFYPRPPGGGRQQKRTKFSSVFAQKGEEFASLRRGKRKICRWRFKKDKFWALIWCEGSGKSVCASASHCG